MKKKLRAGIRGDALREQMLWAAREVFLEQGFERASMDEVARRAKTTKRTLYAHFENKQTLLLAVFEMLKGYFLGQLSTPDTYAKDPAEAMVLFCGRFLEKLLYEGAIRMCRMCAAEAEHFPEQVAMFCHVVFSEVETRLAAYIGSSFNLNSKTSTQAAQNLMGQVLYPRFPRALFGIDPLTQTFSEDGLSPDFDLRPIRKAVTEFMRSLTTTGKPGH